MEKTYSVSTQIYSTESIDQGIQDFSGIAPISFSENALRIQGEDDEEIEQVFQEFMNYILSI